jgi:N-acetylated-alpha-linked acidic dipeptidase
MAVLTLAASPPSSASMPPRTLARAALAVAVAALAGAPLATPARAQPAPAPAALPGYAAAAAAQQRALEASAIARPDSARAAAHARALSAEAHVAGTPAQARTRDYVVGEMRKLGLETSVRAYRVYLPHATGVRVWRRGADRRLALACASRRWPATHRALRSTHVNGSAPGERSGEVVYANYGLLDDYRVLDSLGVSVRGRVVWRATALVPRHQGARGGAPRRRGAPHLQRPGRRRLRARRRLPRGPMRPPRRRAARQRVNRLRRTRARPAASTANARPPARPTRSGAAHPGVPISYGTRRSCSPACAARPSRSRGRAGCRSGTTPAPAPCAPACAWPTTARRPRTRRCGTPSPWCAAPSSPTSW